MKDVFNFHRERDSDLKQQNIFREALVNPVYNNTEKIFFLGPHIEEMIPRNIKKLEFTNSFTKEIKI